MRVILVLVAGWCGFLLGIGTTLWWVSRNPLGGNPPPDADGRKW